LICLALPGWITFADIAHATVSRCSDVYVVVRPTDDATQFCADAPYRGDRALPIADPEKGWVPGTRLLYTGVASLLVQGGWIASPPAAANSQRLSPAIIPGDRRPTTPQTRLIDPTM
jgi:hypothetical protein